MASNFESSIDETSDSFFDFSCVICQEKDRNSEAEFYCAECCKFYCTKCMEYHNHFFKKHETLGKENIGQWPQTNVDAQEQSSSSDQLVEEYQPGAVIKHDPIIKVKSRKKYSVKIKDDSSKCDISGICETAAGELLIADRINSNVKLLNKTYKVVSHCDLPVRPRSMCSIDSSLVAVIAMYNGNIHFIKVANGQLKMERILNLKLYCWGIAHHQGILYITSGTALYQYTVDGTLLRKLYDDTSGDWEGSSCAVSPGGDRIYVATKDSGQLVTLSRDGIVISKLTDPALNWGKPYSPGLHVTDAGQVLMCGVLSEKILQVDRDGGRRLAEVVTKKDGAKDILSVYFSTRTGSLIVGMWDNNNIMVFKAQ